MRAVEPTEILDLSAYELVRSERREHLLELKKLRRVHVGEHVTLLFENRDTVLYQIQEMVRIERLVKPDEIAHEVQTYNELVPAEGGLSATLFIEYESVAERDQSLRDLLGLEHHVWLEVGAGERLGARFDRRQVATEKLSAVQFVRFPLTGAARALWPSEAEKGGVAVVVEHPRYQARSVLSQPVARELERDFAE